MKRVFFLVIAAFVSMVANAQNEMEALAKAAEAQVGVYETYDASERPVDKYGLVSTDGCCIDVLLRAWDKAVAHHDVNKELSTIYRQWYEQMGKTAEWQKRGGTKLAHRRCRNVIQLFNKHLVPWKKVQKPERGCIIFYVDNGTVWHVGIAINETQLVHNIGYGVMISDINLYGEYACFKHD